MKPIPPPPTGLDVEEYLEHEKTAEQKHEYLAGQLHAMVGAGRQHAVLAMSVAHLLLPHARRAGCQLLASDMKVRIDHDGESWFYYPDLVLACSKADADPYFVRQPCLIVEVLSPGTEHIDTREKLIAYRLLPSLREYLILRQDRREADIHQRNIEGGWRHQRFTEPTDTIPFACFDAAPSLAEIYVDLPDLAGP